jgi:hypothetical protein
VLSSGALFDVTGDYRYLLWRTWDVEAPRVGFVMLNPSKADADRDDPTIRRCVAFARSWRFGGVEVANLFAFRACSPAGLFAAANPVGSEDDRHLTDLAGRVDRLVAAWGNYGARFGWGDEVRHLLGGGLWQLRLTARGQPAHPLYLPGSARPQPWRISVPSL